MTNKIDWTQNCLTQGIHNGRDGELWNMPLGYAAQHVFRAATLRELVIQRIYWDAVQFVEHGDLSFTMAWALDVKNRAEELYPARLQVTIGKLSNYYKSEQWGREQEQVAQIVRQNKLNENYAALHTHDTINQLCRQIGVSASAYAEKGES